MIIIHKIKCEFETIYKSCRIHELINVIIATTVELLQLKFNHDSMKLNFFYIYGEKIKMEKSRPDEDSNPGLSDFWKANPSRFSTR